MFGLLILLPATFSVLDSDHYTFEFFITSAICQLLGLSLFLSQRNYHAELNHRTALALVTFAWVFSGLVGAVPFLLSDSVSSPVDAVFESVSGFTGTGASIIVDVEKLDRGVLFWRSLTQWLGGMGIIVFFVAVLPTLGFGGVQLFRAEVAGPQKDRITPRVRETARKLWVIYLSLTTILAVILCQLGMPWFDALNHSFTTLATGGFSTRNNGIAAFDSAAIDYVLAIFMLLGAISFSIHYRVFLQRDGSALNDTELKWFLGIIAGTFLISFVCLYVEVYSDNAAYAARMAFFTVCTIISTTGFSHQDHAAWPPLLQVIIVLLMVMGGMSGSTAGGLKCIRLAAAFKQLVKQLMQVVHPKAVLTIKANGHSIPEHVIDAIWGLIFLYFLVFSVAAALLCAQGVDLVTSSSAVFSALSNIGPALGELGPTSNYANLTDLSKVTLIACMLMGRLEFFTALVIITPAYWRR